jgi:hypothetical protein
MAKDKKIFSVLSKTVIVGLIVTAISLPVKAKLAAVDVSAEDNKVYEYQYKPLKDSAVAAILNGNNDPNAKLYVDFVQRKKSIIAYYDDVRKAYIGFDTISEAAIAAATSGGNKTFDFNAFIENPSNPTITVNTNKVTADANGNVVIEQSVGDNKDLSDAGTHSTDYLISSVGAFGAADTSKVTTIDGNVSISNIDGAASGSITLQNLNINGTLTVDFGAGNLILDNVKVNGVTVNNIGSNSIHIRGNSSIANININHKNNNAHIVVDTGSTLQNISVNSDLVISGEGKVNSLIIKSQGAKVDLDAASIGTVLVNKEASGAQINIPAGTTVTTLNANATIAVTGTGIITTANLGVSGTTMQIKPTNVGVMAGVTAVIAGQNVNSSNAVTIVSVPTDSTPATPVVPVVTPPSGGGGIYVPPITAPTVGINIITTALITDTSLTLSWTKATDNTTAQSNLKYYLYESTLDDIDTVANCAANGTLLNQGGTANIGTYNVTGLTASTPYYFNVVVEDQAGNKSVYMTEFQTTASVQTYTASGNVVITDGSGVSFANNKFTIPAHVTTFNFTDNGAAKTATNVGRWIFEARTYTIGGTVSSGAGNPSLSRLMVKLYRATDTGFQNLLASALVQSDGTYTIISAENGNYVIRISAYENGSNQEATAPVIVNGADVTNADLTVNGLIRVVYQPVGSGLEELIITDESGVTCWNDGENEFFLVPAGVTTFSFKEGGVAKTATCTAGTWIFTVAPTAVVVGTGSVSVAAAGNGTITGLAAGTKYVVTEGTSYYGVLANGTLSTAQTDKVTAEGLAVSLTGTAITGLTNGNTYTVEVVESAAPALTASAAAGSAAGTTAITATPITSGDSLVYKVSSTAIETPNVGNTVTGTSPLTSGDISGVDAANNKYVAVYEVDGNGYIVGFTLITLTLGNINMQGGAAITGLNGVLQLGETTAETAATTEAGAGGWRSSNTNVATIDPSTGAVTAQGTGTTTISYTASASNYVNSQTITVYGAANVVNPTILTVQVGAGTVTPTGFTAAGTGQTIVWQSSNTSAATVDPSTGEITAVAAGSTTISYKVTDTSGIIVAKGNSLISVQGAAVPTASGTLTLSPANAGYRASQTIEETYTPGESMTNGTVVFILPTGFSAVVTSDEVKIANGEATGLTQGQISSDGQTVTITGVNASARDTIVLTLTNKTVPAVSSYAFSATADADGSAVSKTPSAGTGTESAAFISDRTCEISGSVTSHDPFFNPASVSGTTVYLRSQDNTIMLATGIIKPDGTYTIIAPVRDGNYWIDMHNGASDNININSGDLTGIRIMMNLY